MVFCFILKFKIMLFDLLSLVFIHLVAFIAIFCYSLSFVGTCYHLLSLLIIHCHSLPNVALALRLVVTCCTTRCHLLYYSLSLIVTRFTTRLSFYKWSPLTFSHWIEIFISFYPKQNIISVSNVALSILDLIKTGWAQWK